MTRIKLEVIDENIEFTSSPPVYSGDVNTIETEFKFGENWDSFTKTAVFYREIETPYLQLLYDDVCYIPAEVMRTQGRIYIGVFGVLGDKVKTSEVVFYDIGTGVVTAGNLPKPSDDIWGQIFKELGEIRLIAENIQKDQEQYQAEWSEKVDGSIQEAKNATTQCYDAISALQVEIFDMNGGDPFTQPSEGDIDANGGYPV